MPSRPDSIVEAFVRHTEDAPEKLCLKFEGEEWTYERLRGRAEAFAAALRSWGLELGERVALFLGNHSDFLAAYLGVHLAGGVVVPVNTAYRRAELRHIFDDAGVRVCFTDGERRPELERVREDLTELEAVIELGEELDAFLDGAEADTTETPDGEDLAVIAYTSGTTGRSKGAMLLHRNMVANTESICEAWHWTADDHLLLTLPLFHTHGLMVGAHGTLFAGASAELHRSFDATRVYDALLEGSFTMFFGVPTMYTRLLREAESRDERPRPLRLYVAGSGARRGETRPNPPRGGTAGGPGGGAAPGARRRGGGIKSRGPFRGGKG